MASVTQKISNLLGGVSRQPDVKKLPGQLRTCTNAYPDPTFGLIKRPGTEFKFSLSTTPNKYVDGKWFFIRRAKTEIYVGCIYNGNLEIWNAITGVLCTATPITSSYLQGTKDDFDVLSIQDYTVITNKTKAVALTAAPTFNPGRKATLRPISVEYSSEYKVTINNTSISTYKTRDSDAANQTALNIAEHLTELETRINALNISGLTVTKLKSTLELSSTSSFTITASGGVSNDELVVFQDSVNNISELPEQSIHGRVVKITNTISATDSYYVEFVATNGVSGPGYWQETIAPNVSTAFDGATMPHRLVNTAVNTFTFGTIPWVAREVGDDDTNAAPSFVNTTISKTFFHNNRLGFLSGDNVILSEAGDYINFWSRSALTQIASDPIDISCSSLTPTSLQNVLPVPQGLVIFSANQQFLMYADQGILTPTTTTIKSLSNYECDQKISPVDVGTNIVFASKTEGYTRVFGMLTRGQEENPDVVDISRVVSDWIPDTVDSMFASAQNSFVGLYARTSRDIYFYRFYNAGQEKDVMQSWFQWELPGNVQFAAVDSDDLYVITYQGDQYAMLKTTLNQTPDNQILVTNQGQTVQICMDMYALATQVTYDAGNNWSRCALPFANVATLDPVLIVAGTAQVNSVFQSGFTLSPTVVIDNGIPYFQVNGTDLSSQAAQVYVGYKYNFNVELPTFYYQLDKGSSDYTATLTISRVKVSAGLSSDLGFSLRRKGADIWEDVQFVQDADFYLANDVPLAEQNMYTLPIYQRNENFNLRIISDSPFPVALSSVAWEGNYSPRYYRRQ